MAKKKRPRQIFVKAYVSAEDKAGICAEAARLRMPVSEYVRCIVTRFRAPESKVDAEAIDKLMAVNANMARVGNLLRNELDALGASRVSSAFMERVEKLHDEIRETQGMLRACVLDISGGGRGRGSG